jgi:hypothetical protein
MRRAATVQKQAPSGYSADKGLFIYPAISKEHFMTKFTLF